MSESHRMFHDLVDDWRRADRDLNGLSRIVYNAHLDEHDGAFRLCPHPPCRAVADLGRAA